MIRKVIEINEEKCNGCGLCVNACHESAIGLVDGKARLLRDDYCDGLGDCLPACPTGAITFVEREAAAYDHQAVMENKRKKATGTGTEQGQAAGRTESQLTQWPVQIKLAPVTAPYFQQADLLIAADCTAYAYGSFHTDFIRGKITLIGCPKLDGTDYSQKLAEIFRGNQIRSVTVTRMTVPCCGGLERMVKAALENSGKNIPCRVVTIGIDGKIVKE